MKAPNSELFRLLRFAIRYPGWHPYQGDAAPHVLRGYDLEFFEVDTKAKRFRLATPEPEYVARLDGLPEYANGKRLGQG
jgi:hypothetical protein